MNIHQLSDEKITQNAQAWKGLLTSKAEGRKGIDNLIRWLETTDFFHAPASTKYHEAYYGGLVEHSLAVYFELSRINAANKEKGLPRYKDSTIAVSALLHDVAKACFYVEATHKEGFTVDDKFPFGHGEKSIYLVEKHISLAPDEAIAIRWHMGAFDDATKGGCSRTYTQALENFMLCSMLHIADMTATYLRAQDISMYANQE